MKNWYKTAGTLLIGACMLTHGYAQTHYGVGAGTQGPGHAFFGKEAGASNTVDGLDNSFFGHQSGFSNVDGVHNVFVGYWAGYLNNGGGNVFVGYKSGYQNVSGPFNTFIGGYTGQNNLNGAGNFFGGYATGYQNTSGSYNTFLGTQTAVDNKIGQKNVFVGYGTGNKNSNGNFNVFMGVDSGKSNVGGSSNTYIGYQADGSASLQNAAAIGANAIVTADNCLVLGYKANVGIGISAPVYQLHLSTNSAGKPGSSQWAVASDSRLKKNITNFTDGLELLKQIHPVWFQYNGKAGIETGEKNFVGIIAQEMRKIAPYTIGTFTHQDSLGNKTEYLDYDANAITYILINSVKEQQRMIEEKEARIAVLEKNQQDLIARLEALEQNSPVSETGLRKVAQTTEMPFIEQNIPNGFSQNTSIRYYVPEFVKAAAINIYNSKGAKIDTRAITARGKGEMMFSAEGLERGVLLYELMIDGKSVGGKKMLIE